MTSAEHGENATHLLSTSFQVGSLSQLFSHWPVVEKLGDTKYWNSSN
jgi:hypothetical protein